MSTSDSDATAPPSASSSASRTLRHHTAPPPRRAPPTKTPPRFTSIAPNAPGVGLDLHEARRASSLRVLDAWSQLAQRYSRPLNEDDILDLRTETVVQDRGVLRAARTDYDFGYLTASDDVFDEKSNHEGENLDAEDDPDELDAFAPAPEASDDLESPGTVAVSIMDMADAQDLRDFLEAERRRRDAFGEDEDVLEEVVDFGEYDTESEHEEPASIDQEKPSPTSHAAVTTLDDESSEDELSAWNVKGESVVPTPPRPSTTSFPRPKPRPAYKIAQNSPQTVSPRRSTLIVQMPPRLQRDAESTWSDNEDPVSLITDLEDDVHENRRVKAKPTLNSLGVQKGSDRKRKRLVSAETEMTEPKPKGSGHHNAPLGRESSRRQTQVDHKDIQRPPSRRSPKEPTPSVSNSDTEIHSLTELPLSPHTRSYPQPPRTPPPRYLHPWEHDIAATQPLPPPLADPHAQYYIAHAMQHLAAYLLNPPPNLPPPPWLPPYPPSSPTKPRGSHVDADGMAHGSEFIAGPSRMRSSSEARRYSTEDAELAEESPASSSRSPYRRTALVRRSQSRGRRVWFSLDEEIIGLGGFEEEVLEEGQDRNKGKATAEAVSDESRRQINESSERGRKHKRAQTPGPSGSRQLSAVPQLVQRSRSVPRR